MWKLQLLLQTVSELGAACASSSFFARCQSQSVRTAAAAAAATSVDDNPASLVIAWCTATGTAKRYALLTSVDAQEMGIHVAACSDCADLSIMTAVGPRSRFFLLMFVSTQGDGDAPSSLAVFQRMFDNECCPPEIAPSSPRMVGFHVVALGDSSYRRFCDGGKQAAAWLSTKRYNALKHESKNVEQQEIEFFSPCDARLGASAAEDLAENAVSRLLRRLQQETILGSSPLSAASSSIIKSPLSCSFKKVDPESGVVAAAAPFPAPSSIQPPSSAERPVELLLLACDVLCKKSQSATLLSPSSPPAAASSSVPPAAAATVVAVPRTVVRLEFDALPITSRCTVQSGDHVSIAPTNSLHLARRCAAALGISGNDDERLSNSAFVFSATSTSLASNRASPKPLLPATVSFLDALRFYPDLSGPPRRRFVARVAATLCDSEEERARVRAATAKPGSNVVDVLEAAAPRRMSLEDFFFLCPRLMPRFFSVSDCWYEDDGSLCSENNNNGDEFASAAATVETISSKKGSRLALMVALVDDGCFSRMIERVMSSNTRKNETNDDLVQERFFFSLRRTTFHLSLANPMRSKPVLLIGSGTGVAPYVGFCRELRDHKHVKLIKIMADEKKRKQKQQQQQQQREEDDAKAAASQRRDDGGDEDECSGMLLPAAKAARADSSDGSMMSDDSTLLKKQKKGGGGLDSLEEQRRRMWPVSLLYGFTRRGPGSPFLDLFLQARDDGTLDAVEEAESRPAAISIPVAAPMVVTTSETNNNNEVVSSSSTRATTPTTTHVAKNPPTVATIKKKYVQDRIAEIAARIRRLLVDDGGSIFICGRSSMAKEVEATIVERVLVKCAGMSREGALRFMQQLRGAGRLRTDVWESG